MRTIPLTPKASLHSLKLHNGNTRLSSTHPSRSSSKGSNSDTAQQDRRKGVGVFRFIILGLCLSAAAVQITEDEYFQGPVETKMEKMPVHIAFENLGCRIGDRTILQNVTGEINTGRLTAVLGQSGSGKTTFASALLGRSRRICDESDGAVFLNGESQSLEAFLDRVGFVPQDDVLYSDLTVWETLEYSARWRLPRSTNASTLGRIINDTIRHLQLTQVQSTRIGNVKTRGISGGEKKRTSIGMELVALPSVLVMDEPTSGLDSASAHQTMQILRNIVDQGVTIVTVLHQPSGRSFNLVDDLALIQNGEIAFIGEKNSIVNFLKFAGYKIVLGGVVLDSNDESESGVSLPEFILDVLANLEKPKKSASFKNLDQSRDCKSAKKEKNCPNVNNPNHCCVVDESILRDDLVRCMNDYNATDCFDVQDGMMHPRLPSLWRIYSNLTNPQNITNRNYKSILKTTVRVPKPGLKSQTLLWFEKHLSLSFRNGVIYEALAVVLMSSCVALMRSYNNVWNRKAGVNLFLSMSVSLLGMLSAVYNDEIAPVQRAAAAGMMLNAHEFGALTVSLLRGYFLCHIFAFSYFSVLWTRTGIWCVESNGNERGWFEFDFWQRKRFHEFYQFQHTILLQYLVASAWGSVVCVLVAHDNNLSHTTSIALLLFFHVFSLYSPNSNQIKRGSTILSDRIDLGRLINLLCRISYVRYFMEAILLWDPDTSDNNARTFVMRYYSYNDKNRGHCLNVLFFMGMLIQSLRFIIFTYRYSNDFNSLYDTPLLFAFLFKVFSMHVLAYCAMYLVQEWYFWMLERRRQGREALIVNILKED